MVPPHHPRSRGRGPGSRIPSRVSGRLRRFSLWVWNADPWVGKSNLRAQTWFPGYLSLDLPRFRGTVLVLSPEEFQTWEADRPTKWAEALGLRWGTHSQTGGRILSAD